MGKIILFQESVTFSITNRWFDSSVQFVQSDGLLHNLAHPAYKWSLFFLSAVETPAVIEMCQTAPVTVLGKQQISVALAYDAAHLSLAT